MTIVRRAVRTILGLALWVSALGAGRGVWTGEELPASGEGLAQLRVQVTVDPTRSTHTNRNPDGHNAGFGNRYLDSRSDDPDHLSVFAAARDDGALTVVLVSKDLDHPATVRLSLGSKARTAGTLFRLPNPPGPIRREAIKASDRGVSINVPALSAVMLVAL